MTYINVNVGTPDPGNGQNALAVNAATRALLVDLAAGVVSFPSTVTLAGSVALAGSTATIGHVVLDAGSATIGKLAGSTETIGGVVAQPSTATIGHVVLDASSAAIGKLAGSTETIGTVNVRPGTSLLGMAVATPTTTSLALGSTDGLAVAIPAETRRLTIYASGAGITMNYNAAATSETPPVSTNPTPLDCTAADAALIEFLGDTETISFIFSG